jgi:hypothetical protein
MGGVSFFSARRSFLGAAWWLAGLRTGCHKAGMSIASPLHRARTGPCAGIGIALSLLAMLGTSMHVLLVEHELCDEHGALVEGDAHAVDVDADPAADAHDQDVHCPLAVAATATLPVGPELAFDASSVTALDEPLASPDAPVCARDVWRTAPKTSPPSA